MNFFAFLVSYGTLSGSREVLGFHGTWYSSQQPRDLINTALTTYRKQNFYCQGHS